MKQLIENTMTAVKKLLPAGVCFLVAASLTCIGIFAAPPAPAQAQESHKPSFDVASVKPSDCRGKFLFFQPGRYSGCASLKEFIAQAYEVEDEGPGISGGPGWIDSDVFSIEAKAEGVTDRDTLRLMMQSLLEERFGLKIHYETREQPVYSLVVAKGGHKLKEAGDERGKFRGMSGRINPDTGQMESTGHAVTMPSFAHCLTDDLVDRKVFDKTGLKGRYDFELHFARNPQSDPRGRSGMMQPAPFGATDPMPSAELSGPSIFTALQEQLGLKLEADKAPIEFLVIDSAEKPSEN